MHVRTKCGAKLQKKIDICKLKNTNKKYIYTMYIYSKSKNFAFFIFYPMGILWLWYGYLMVRVSFWYVFACFGAGIELPLRGYVANDGPVGGCVGCSQGLLLGEIEDFLLCRFLQFDTEID